MKTVTSLPRAHAARIALGIACWIVAFILYLLAVRTGPGRGADNLLFQQFRERLTAWTWIPDGGTLARDQLALLAIGVGVVCAACLVSRCSIRMTTTALAVACCPGAVAVVLKAVLTRPVSLSDIASHNSFPSGTVAGFAGVAAALGLVARHRIERVLVAAAWLGVGLVGLTVIRAHWHRPSDVVGAVLLAVGAWSVASGVIPRAPVLAIRPKQSRATRDTAYHSFARR